MMRWHRVVMALWTVVLASGLSTVSWATPLSDCQDEFNAGRCPDALKTYYCATWISGETAGLADAVVTDFERIGHRHGKGLKGVGTVKEGVSYSAEAPPPNTGAESLVVQVKQGLEATPGRSFKVLSASCESRTEGKHTVSWEISFTHREKEVLYPCSTDDPGCRIKCADGPGKCKPSIVLDESESDLKFSGTEKLITNELGKIVSSKAKGGF